MRILILILAALPAWCAVCTPASGNWAAVCTDGDTLILSNGVIVTCPTGATCIIGSSPADDTGTPAIQCASTSGTGVFTVAAGATLKYRGPVRQCATWAVGAGATITHDSSLAAVPATANYTWLTGLTAGTAAQWQLNGTAGNRITLNKAPGSGNAGGCMTASPLQGQCKWQLAYTTITDWGTATSNLTMARLDTTAVTWDHVIVDGCGPIQLSNSNNAVASWTFTNTTIRNPLAAVMTTVRDGTAAVTVKFDRVYHEGRMYFYNPGIDFQVTDSVLASPVSTADEAVRTFNGGAYKTSLWRNVLVVERSTTASTRSFFPSGTLSRTYDVRTSTLGTYSYWAYVPSNEPASVSSTLVDGWISDGTRTAHGRNLNWSCATKPVVIRNLIFTQYINLSDEGVNLATGTNCTGVAGATGTFEHLTSTTGKMFDHETYNPTQTNKYTAVRYNLFWHPTGTAAANAGAFYCSSGCVLGVAPFANNVDYNAWWNITTSPRYGIDYAQFSPSPGAHDINGINPRFLDSTRDFIAFGKMLNPANTTWQLTLAEFAKMNNDSGYDARYNVSYLYDWVWNGWRPTNLSLKRLMPDGSDPGGPQITVYNAPGITGGGVY